MEKIDRELKGRNFKRKVIDLLKADDFAEVLEIFGSYPARRVINPLFSCLCSTEPEIKWRAITALGAVVANLAQEDMESARVVMRRMIWNLNDESGGIGWGVPETMGEVMARHQGLAREYVNILMSYIRKDGNFLEHEPLQQGVLWGLGRLAQTSPELLYDAVPHLQPFLSSGDAVLRGLAAWTLGVLGGGRVDQILAELESDDTEVTLCLNGTERKYRISELAIKAPDADV
jgi:HEAT repeat protein